MRSAAAARAAGAVGGFIVILAVVQLSMLGVVFLALGSA